MKYLLSAIQEIARGNIRGKITGRYIRGQLILQLLFAAFFRGMLEIGGSVITFAVFEFGILQVSLVEAHCDLPVAAVARRIVTDVSQQVIR